MAIAVKKGAAPKKTTAAKPTAKKEAASKSKKASADSVSIPATLLLGDVYADEESRLSFLLGCVCLAQADGDIADTEKAFFINAAAGMEISTERQVEVSEWPESDQDPEDVRFNTKREALFFIREALQFCYMDGHFSAEERELLMTMCNRFGVSRASFEYIEDWVKEGINWRQDGERLLDLEG